MLIYIRSGILNGKDTELIELYSRRKRLCSSYDKNETVFNMMSIISKSKRSLLSLDVRHYFKIATARVSLDDYTDCQPDRKKHRNLFDTRNID